MKQIINFNDIATHKAFEKFKGKRVAIEIISLDGEEIEKLQNKYLYYCYQIAAFLSDTQGLKFYVKDAILINSIKLNKSNIQIKSDKNGNMIFFVKSKHFTLMNVEELQTLLQETVDYWMPIFDLEPNL